MVCTYKRGHIIDELFVNYSRTTPFVSLSIHDATIGKKSCLTMMVTSQDISIHRHTQCHTPKQTGKCSWRTDAYFVGAKGMLVNDLAGSGKNYELHLIRRREKSAHKGGDTAMER